MTSAVVGETVSAGGRLEFVSPVAVGSQALYFQAASASGSSLSHTFGEPSSSRITIPGVEEEEEPDETEDAMARQGRAEIERGDVIDLEEFRRTLGLP